VAVQDLKFLTWYDKIMDSDIMMVLWRCRTSKSDLGCARLLDLCHPLRALIVLLPPLPHHRDTTKPAEDPRFVMMTLTKFTTDWQRGLISGSDCLGQSSRAIAPLQKT